MAMGIRMTIGRKIGMGFGLFIFFALVVVVLTNRTLERSRSINEQINEVYSPSVDALVRLRNLTVNAHMLIKHWALLESRADAPEKTALLEITDKELPGLLDRVDTLMAHWDREEVAIMSRIMPQMNVFVAGFPIKILLGLVTIAATLPLLGGYMRIVFDRLAPGLLGMFR